MLLGEAGSIPALGLLMVYQTYDFIWGAGLLGVVISFAPRKSEGFDSPALHHDAV